MSGTSQNVVYGSLAVAGLMAVTCLIDLFAGVPFGGQTLLDIVFLVAGGLTVYMAIDCLKK